MANFPLLPLLSHRNQLFSFKLFLGLCRTRRKTLFQEGIHMLAFMAQGLSLGVIWAFPAKTWMESRKALLCSTSDMGGWGGRWYQQDKKKWGKFADKKSVNVLTALGSNVPSNIPQMAILLVGRWRRMDHRKCLGSHALHDQHLPLPTLKTEYWMRWIVSLTYWDISAALN